MVDASARRGAIHQPNIEHVVKLKKAAKEHKKMEFAQNVRKLGSKISHLSYHEASWVKNSKHPRQQGSTRHRMCASA